MTRVEKTRREEEKLVDFTETPVCLKCRDSEIGMIYYQAIEDQYFDSDNYPEQLSCYCKRCGYRWGMGCHK